MANIDYLNDHKEHCENDPDYARAVLIQHMLILGDDIEKIAKLYEHMKVELNALLEKRGEDK